MTKTPATEPAFATIKVGIDVFSADIVELDAVTARRELFLAHAAAASRVAVYEFKIPAGATAPALNAPDQQRDARDQLLLIVALTGGAVGKAWGGMCARVPVAAAERFEVLARPLIETFLVAYWR